jgi:hypothetical protein
MATRTTSGRKKSTRKKAAATRKTSTVKKTGTRKKTTRKKTTGTRKKATPTRKTSTGARKKTVRKTTTRKYSKATSDNVGTELHEMKRGTLRSGRSGKKVTSRKQAIAIGLSEARASGKKVPPNPNRARKKKS